MVNDNAEQEQRRKVMHEFVDSLILGDNGNERRDIEQPDTMYLFYNIFVGANYFNTTSKWLMAKFAKGHPIWKFVGPNVGEEEDDD